MKFFLLTCFLSIAFTGALSAQDSIYHRPLLSLNGDSIHLSDYREKKILFVVLPVTNTDTTIQQQLLRFQERYDSSGLQVIGVLAFEEGYLSSLNAGIADIYADNIVRGMLLSQGMYIRKDAESQHPVMQWLTDRNLNGHYKQDADEVGKKFFVNGQGDLYAVMGKESSFDLPMLDKIAGM